MEFGVPELTGGGAVGLGTILVWQLVRLVGKMQIYFDGMEAHRKHIESKFDELISAVRSTSAAPRFIEPTHTPVQKIAAD